MKKIVSLTQSYNYAAEFKFGGKRIVLAGGCFDILHVGHIKFLEKAKKTGDKLILLLESDEAIKNLKGDNRPVNTQSNRAKILSAIESVDLVVLLPRPFDTNDYRNLVNKISPNIIAVTSGDPNINEKKLQARKVNGIVRVVLKKIPDHSTTKLINFL